MLLSVFERCEDAFVFQEMLGAEPSDSTSPQRRGVLR